MKKLAPISSLLLFALLGCGAPSHLDTPHGASEMWAGNWIRTASIDRALIAERTVYPYHFVGTSASLNELGAHTVAVLAEYYRDYPGELNLRRGAASDELYDRRIAAVQEALTAAGVQADLIAISDGPAGGGGISSNRVLMIFEAESSTLGYSGESLTSGFSNN